MDTVKLCEKITKIAIYLLVFLVPLFFLPWTSNVLDFNKQFLLLFLVFVALVSWLIRVLLSGKLELKFSLIDLPIVILFLVYIFSTLFSLDRSGSFWGYPLNVSAGLLSLLGFVVFYFLISNILEKMELFWVLFFLVFSGFLSGLFGIFQIFGKFLLPFDWAKVTSFNTIGTVNSLGLFLACLVPLTTCLLLFAKRLIRFLLAIFALVMLAGLVLINFWVAWLILIAGSTILIIFGILNVKKTGMGLIILPMVFLIIALFFITLRISLPGLPPTPIEIALSQRAELNIAKKSLAENPILGSGPGTFVYNFAKFKSRDLNQTVFWNVRFSSGASEVLDKLITTGILGILSLGGVFVTFCWFGFKNLKTHLTSGAPLNWWILLGVFSSFIGIILSQLLYPANFSLIFLFWLILGSFSAIETKKLKSWTLKLASSSMIWASAILVLVFVSGLALLFLSGPKYLAETNYLKGLRIWQRGESEEAVNYLTRAINLNPSLDIYFRDLSQIYLIRLNEVLQQKELSQEELINLSQVLINNAINSAKRATDLNPVNVANWNVRGFIYRNMIGILGGAGDWAIKSYQKAATLEPTNPFIFTEIGRVYLAQTDILAREEGKEAEIAENLAKAHENFEKSLELKPDYAPARFQKAMIDVREGKTKEAIAKLEETKQVVPFDLGLAFQIGILYYQDGQYEEAKAEFERAVRLDENYSNARYFLGLIYDQEGKKFEAISQFERIEELNPANQEVQRILVNLRAGKAALEGITSAQPPIEEKPPEIEE